MTNKQIFDHVSGECSKLITKNYSTSFSSGIKLLSKDIRPHIYNIYGFVRLADEIVDSFYDFENGLMFDKFKEQTHWALKHGISTNPVLNSFQHTFNEFKIEIELVDKFLASMEMDLDKRTYDRAQFNEYILGSAEVVGLMCLRVFVLGNEELYKELKPFAMRLGAAFQKINFLRDLKQDQEELGRTYFPNIEFSQLNSTTKTAIEKEIAIDFQEALKGIKKLPKGSRFGVYLAYKYYLRLFKKISKSKVEDILNGRIRIPNEQKAGILVRSYLRHSFNFL